MAVGDNAPNLAVSSLDKHRNNRSGIDIRAQSDAVPDFPIKRFDYRATMSVAVVSNAPDKLSLSIFILLIIQEKFKQFH